MTTQHLRIALVPLLAAAIGLPAVEPAKTTATPAAAATAEQTLTIEVSDKPLDIVLQWISRRAGINVVCNETEYQPKVTMRLVNVSWQEAVDQLVRKYDLVLEKRSESVWELTRPPKVRMEFQDARLTVLLDALARQAGVNIVISDKVDSNRRLTMALNGVPWREAMDVIVKATGYVWIEQNYKIIRIVDPKDVQKDLQTRVFRLNYTNADEASKLIGVALSGDGKVLQDKRSNSLVITDTPVSLDAATRILGELDKRTQEVQIEMKFVEFNVKEGESYGFNGGNLNLNIDNWGYLNTKFFPFSAATGRRGGAATATSPNPDGVPMALPSSTGLVSSGLTFEMLNTLNSTEVIQTPNLRVINNTEAQIQLIRDVRYTETKATSTDAGTSVTLQEAGSSPVKVGMKIIVTPHITHDGFVQMQLYALDSSNEFQRFYESAATNAKFIDLPQVSSKEIKTQIMVSDSETAVIGGILSNSTSEEDNRVPILGSIPVLGWLFRNHKESTEQRNLTIFITPRIIQTSDKDDLEDAKIRLRERLSGLQLRSADERAGTVLGQ